ncbi:MAG TPA: hypothetical protein VGA59_12220 [Ramlibacter sp.]|jgi:hypothetical protein
MKPLDVRSGEDRRQSPSKPEPATGTSGEGAASALEQLINQEKIRVLHEPKDPPRDRASA